MRKSPIYKCKKLRATDDILYPKLSGKPLTAATTSSLQMLLGQKQPGFLQPRMKGMATPHVELRILYH